MPVSETSKATTDAALLENRMVVAPTAGRDRHDSCTPPCSVNLKALDSRFFSTCCRRLESVTRLRVRCGSVCTSKAQPPVFRFVAEWPRDHVKQAGEEDFFGIDRDRARFDLRQIENVADQVQQVGSRAMDGARELDLLAGQVAVRVVGELLAQHQNAVQRRTQLVRHVGQELGLVLRSQRQLLGLLFQRAPRLLDFLVLAFHFDVLLGELLRFLRQLFVGLLQFFLLGLQFGGQLLRLLQQAFRLHGGFNTVEHDADAGGQLFQKRQVRGGEGAQRGQLDHRLDAVFKEHGQHDHISRDGLEQTGADRDGVLRQVADQHAPLFRGALSDQAFSDFSAADGHPAHRRQRPRAGPCLPILPSPSGR